MNIAVVGGSQNRRVIEDAVALQGFIRNNAEILLVPMPEPVLVPPVTEDELEGLVALRRSQEDQENKKSTGVSPEEGADAAEKVFQKHKKEEEEEERVSFAEQMLTEELRSLECFASPPHSSCGHLSSLSQQEKDLTPDKVFLKTDPDDVDEVDRRANKRRRRERHGYADLTKRFDRWKTRH